MHVYTMWKLRKLARIIACKRNIHTATQLKQRACKSFDISEEVNHGLQTGAPIVALESTIITHGMPYPDNLQCALDVERIVREQGAIPATIAVIGGKVTVGLNHAQIAALADRDVNKSVKTSRRDFPYVVSEKLNGGTTVSGTIIVASQIGIPVFVTGGIGGVHRQGESTLDISADLTELGRNSIAVVSSGVKSILDIPRTLEYLETQGVFVAAYSETSDFPAFYSRKSGSYAPCNVTSAQQAAQIISANLALDLKSAMLFAVPVPETEALDEELLQKAIEQALQEAEIKGIRGKHTTPFLLSAVAKITGGRSLQTNMALIKNNAKVGAEIAVELSRIRSQGTIVATASEIVSPVVIGGCVLDLCASLTVPDILLDGSMHYTKFSMSAGGVARNICEALGKLGAQPHLLSAVGNDSHGRYLQANLPAASTRALNVVDSCPSAQCTVVLDSNGECKLLLGEMDIHKHITPEIIMSQEALLKRCPLIVTDGNLGNEALACVLEMADKYGRPVFYEPTDIPVAAAPFSCPNYRALKYISPNLNELRIIAQSLGVAVPPAASDLLSEAAQLGRLVAEYIDTIFVTLGARGLLVVRKGTARDPLHGSTVTATSDVRVRHYKTTEITQLVNVSGAGDCLASGIIVAMLAGLPECVCVSVGLAAAQMALQSRSAVPSVLFDKNHVAWTQSAAYTEL